MNLFSSLTGTVTARLTGADISATLDTLSRKGISLEKCSLISELEAVVTVPRHQYGKLEEICNKRGDGLRPGKKKGLYWTIRSLWKRPVLTVGMGFYLLAAMYLPSRVLFVRVVGNTSVPTRMILAASADRGISFGASRRDVRSEKMKNALLEAVPELQWAGVNTYGCVAEISVRERTRLEGGEASSAFGHIVACRDGVITSCNATQGTPLCVPGQAVSQGDILISGYTDCGLSIRVEQAQGEVFASTRREIRAVTPDSCESLRRNGQEKKKISLLIGKKRINLWKDSGIWDTTCDRMYEEYYITLPGGFQLPFGWTVERYALRDASSASVNPASAQLLLADSAEIFLKSEMLSGTIRDATLSFEEGEGQIQMTGEYSCVEMIGYQQRLEIGEKNGENN